MSIYALDWAWTTDLEKAEKIVLVALAHRHNAKTGQCNPKIDTICSMTGLKKRAVQYTVKALSERGYFKIIPCRNRGKQTSNQYVLNTEGVVFQGAPPRTLKPKSKCCEMHPESVVECTPIDKEVRKVSTLTDNTDEDFNVVEFPKSRAGQ